MPYAYLEITLLIEDDDRASAAEVYNEFKQPFLDHIKGARSKKLLLRNEDVQVIHGFDTAENAAAYLSSELFVNDVVKGLKPYLKAEPDVRVYAVA